MVGPVEQMHIPSFNAYPVIHMPSTDQQYSTAYEVLKGNKMHAPDQQYGTTHPPLFKAVQCGAVRLMSACTARQYSAALVPTRHFSPAQKALRRHCNAL
jgi:hypothetical protein